VTPAVVNAVAMYPGLDTYTDYQLSAPLPSVIGKHRRRLLSITSGTSSTLP